MSLVNLAHVCSHLQNASRARLSTTSVPLSKLHLALALQLQKAGIVSTVTIAGPTAPIPSQVLAHPPSPILSNAPLSTAAAPPTLPATPIPATATPPPSLPPSLLSKLDAKPVITQENRASRRIWLGLKYWNNQPVLSKMGMVSKPTRRIIMGVEGLSLLAKGERSGYVNGVRGIGELLFVSTDKGILEVRECVERGMGGLVLCRAM